MTRFVLDFSPAWQNRNPLSAHHIFFEAKNYTKNLSARFFMEPNSRWIGVQCWKKPLLCPFFPCTSVKKSPPGKKTPGFIHLFSLHVSEKIPPWGKKHSSAMLLSLSSADNPRVFHLQTLIDLFNITYNSHSIHRVERNKILISRVITR